ASYEKDIMTNFFSRLYYLKLLEDKEIQNHYVNIIIEDLEKDHSQLTEFGKINFQELQEETSTLVETVKSMFYGTKGSLIPEMLALYTKLSLRSLSRDQNAMNSIIKTAWIDIDGYKLVHDFIKKFTTENKSIEIEELVSEDNVDSSSDDSNNDKEYDDINTVDEGFDINHFHEKISLYIEKHPDLPPKALSISLEVLNCDEIDDGDLLSEGILCAPYLKIEQPMLFKKLKKKKLLDLQYNEEHCVELVEQEKIIIKSLIINNDVSLSNIHYRDKRSRLALVDLVYAFKKIWSTSSYQNCKKSINEKTFSHDIVSHIIKFIFYDIGLECRWDGSLSESTKCRNRTDQGPNKFPDFFAYAENQQCNFHYEYLFLEISNGPWASGTEHDRHVSEDQFRLYAPFLTIKPFCKVELPLSSHCNTNNLINKMIKLCESLMSLKNIIRQGISRVELLNTSVEEKTTTPPHIPTLEFEPPSGS
ncbi:10795_t:CDS:2, partial [Entrophospora sp. SA101]